jgi:DNA (cytosine-5)-methyltransferase 1
MAAYPFTFVQCSALDVLRSWDLSQFDAIHASPPCQRYSLVVGARHNKRYPGFLGRTRRLLQESGIPYVIENVMSAPVRADFVLCGCTFGLPDLKRQRKFEIGNWEPLGTFRQRCMHATKSMTVLTSSPYQRDPDSDRRHRITHEQASAAMGIGWMTPRGLGEAIPPAYTEFIGTLLREDLEFRGAA